MALKQTATKSLDTRVVIAVILVVLGAVQYFWWKGLIAKPPGPGNGPGAQQSRGANPEFYLSGLSGATVDTIAGAPQPGFKDGLPREARFDGPTGIDIDQAGVLYVADTRNNRVRSIQPGGRVTTLAGAEAGYRDGPATSALFNGPTGIAVAPDGTVYVADTNNHRIRRIRAGQVDTIAGGQPAMQDGSGEAARFNLPASLSLGPLVGGLRTLYVADTGNSRVRRLRIAEPASNAPAIVDTLLSVPAAPAWVSDSRPTFDLAVALPDEGKLKIGTAEYKDMPLERFEQSNRVKEGMFALRRPMTVRAAEDCVYVTDSQYSAIFRVKNGHAQVIAGSCSADGRTAGFQDGRGDEAAFGMPTGMAVDAKGRIFVADTTNNAIRSITMPAPGDEERRPAGNNRQRWRPGQADRWGTDWRGIQVSPNANRARPPAGYPTQPPPAAGQ